MLHFALIKNLRFIRCSPGRLATNHHAFSSRIALEKQVQDALKSVIDPVSTSPRSIISTGLIQGITIDSSRQNVTIDLELFVPGHPYASKIQHDCKEAIRSHLSWVQNVEVNVLTKQPSSDSGVTLLQGSSLVNVQHIIAISSCKGGVGKSTVAVNLACELQGRGLRVGLLDADIYGPSLPLMVQTTDLTVKKSTSNPKWIQPLVCTNGMKIMSFGYVNPRSGAPGAGGKGPAVMRGPIATRLINQLVGATEWGNLDYLLVDMPPGTGDIQITLSQAMSFTGAVIVTTPHELSLADATKGVAMFDDLKVPTLAVVENMSFFDCDHGSRYYPFGRGGRDSLLKALMYAASTESESGPSSSDRSCGSGSGSRSSSSSSASSSRSSNSNSNSKSSSSSSSGSDSGLYARLRVCPLHHLPLSTDISGVGSVDGAERSNNRSPVVIRLPESAASKVYAALADDVITEILKMQMDAQALPSLTFIEGRGLIMRYFSSSNATEHIIPAIELRIRDPQTGRLLPDHVAKRASVGLQRAKPLHFDFKGNYGVAINWSDGHFADIFPFEVLKTIAHELGPTSPCQD